MEEQEKMLKRYYRGESTIEEERQLKSAFRGGKLPDDPMLSFRGVSGELPAGFSERIREGIRKRHLRVFRYRWIATAGIAASFVLIIFLRSLLQTPVGEHLQFSDDLKKMRFENALRTIGNVLEERNLSSTKVLYEDNKLIIAIE